MMKKITNHVSTIIFSAIIFLSLTLYPTSGVAVSLDHTDEETEVDENEKKPGFYTDSFHILPEIQLTTYYDDNIYASAEAEESDGIAVVSPTVKFRSLWESHSLNLDAGAKIGEYMDNNAENYEDTWVDLDGKYDLDNENSLFGSLGFSTKHEGRDSKENIQIREEITTYDVTRMELGVRRNHNDYTSRLGVTYEELDFDNVGTLFNDARDRTVTGLGLRTSKKTSEKYRVFLQGLINQRDYDQALDINGFNRDSDGYSAALGISRAFTEGGKIEAYAGVLSQDYDDPRFGSTSEPDYGLKLHWYPSQTVKLIGNLKRSLRETTEPGASGYLNTLLNLQLDKKLMTDVIGYISFSHGLAEYQELTREDDYNTFGIGLKYFMSSHIYLTTSFSHLSNDSNDVSSALTTGESYDFDKNLLLLSIKVRLAP